MRRKLDGRVAAVIGRTGAGRHHLERFDMGDVDFADTLVATHLTPMRGGTLEIRKQSAPLDRDHRPPAAPDVVRAAEVADQVARSEEHTSELQSLMRISYAVVCL